MALPHTMHEYFWKLNWLQLTVDQLGFALLLVEKYSCLTRAVLHDMHGAQ